MIVDSSALVAALVDAPERDEVLACMGRSPSLGISAATYLETAIVVDKRHRPTVSRRFDQLLAQLDVEVIPVTAEQARIARAAYRDFGKGSGHPARLNFGDCFAYALATDTGEPLLFVGNDFRHTDVRCALPAAPR